MAAAYQLSGFEHDDMLAFLALLGLMRALDASDEGRALKPRAAWTADYRPWPVLHLARAASQQEIAEIVAASVVRLAAYHDFQGRNDPDYTPEEARDLLETVAHAADRDWLGYAEVYGAVVNDLCVRWYDTERIAPTPLCLLGSGHQHFLERLTRVPASTTAESVTNTLFVSWLDQDSRDCSFRWEPQAIKRYAYMASNPSTMTGGAQLGANQLAAIAVALFPILPANHATLARTAIRPFIPGGSFDAPGGFSFSWPIWHEPATLSTMVAMTRHRELTAPAWDFYPEHLASLGITKIMRAHRVFSGRFMGMSRAAPILITEQ